MKFHGLLQNTHAKVFLMNTSIDSLSLTILSNGVYSTGNYIKKGDTNRTFREQNQNQF